MNHLIVCHYECRERFNVNRFNRNRVDDCSANHHDRADKKARVDLYIRATVTSIIRH